ncbi:MAG: glycerophosphodiester phosphodiesterase family protein [Christensenellales bacterium]
MKNDWLYDVFVAHRGLHDEKNGIVENTLPAFAAAVEEGYNIELDVQLTRDGKLVVFHDDNFKRVCGLDADVDSLDYDYIKKNVRFTADPSPETYVPLFSEVAALCVGKVGIMIEIKKKSDDFYDYKVEEALLRELDGYKGDFIVKSFNPFAVDYFRIHAPLYRRGFLCCKRKIEEYSPDTAAKVREILFDKEKRVEFFDYGVWQIGSDLYNKLRGAMPIIVWTVTSQQQYDENERYFDNMIFESFIPKEK